MQSWILTQIKDWELGLRQGDKTELVLSIPHGK